MDVVKPEEKPVGDNRPYMNLLKKLRLTPVSNMPSKIPLFTACLTGNFFFLDVLFCCMISLLIFIHLLLPIMKKDADKQRKRQRED